MKVFYLIKDENSKVVFANTNTACFASILHATSNNSHSFIVDDNISPISKVTVGEFLKQFLPNKRIEIVCDPNISQDHLEKYCEGISSICGKFDVQPIEENYHLNWNSNFTSEAETISQAKYKICFNYSDINDLVLFKVALYLLRPTIESPLFVEEFCSKPDGIDHFQWMRILSTRGQYITHNYFSGIYQKNYRDKTCQVYRIDTAEHFLGKMRVADFNTLGQNLYSILHSELVRYLPYDTVITKEILVEWAKEDYLKAHPLPIEVPKAPIKVARKKSTKKAKLKKYE